MCYHCMLCGALQWSHAGHLPTYTTATLIRWSFVALLIPVYCWWSVQSVAAVDYRRTYTWLNYKCAEGHRLCPTCCLQMIACCSSALMGHKRWQSSVDLRGTTRALVMMDCKFLKVPFFNIGVTYVYIQYSSLFVSYVCMFILKTV